MNNMANFHVNQEKCIGCGLCIKVCPGGILHLNEQRKCEMDEIDSFGWNGCWKCEHCQAVCPKGAISAELENGMTVKVPLFINNGDEIIVSTEDGKYVSRK